MCYALSTGVLLVQYGTCVPVVGLPFIAVISRGGGRTMHNQVIRAVADGENAEPRGGEIFSGVSRSANLIITSSHVYRIVFAAGKLPQRNDFSL